LFVGVVFAVTRVV